MAMKSFTGPSWKRGGGGRGLKRGKPSNREKRVGSATSAPPPPQPVIHIPAHTKTSARVIPRFIFNKEPAPSKYIGPILYNPPCSVYDPVDL
jgi:hypothetical protein